MHADASTPAKSARSPSRPGVVLLGEVGAAILCGAIAVGVGSYAYAAHGKWHLLVGGVAWLTLSVIVGLVVTAFWGQLGPYPRLFFRGLGDVLGVAALLALLVLNLAAAFQHDIPAPWPDGDEGGLKLWLQLRHREHLAVLWPVALATLGGVTAGAVAMAIAWLRLADGVNDFADVALLIGGVGLGSAAGFHFGARRVVAGERDPVAEPR